MPRALLVSPHPDDETIGVGGTVVRLLAAGWDVMNLACSLGRPADHERRRAELARASERLGIHSETLDPPVPISSTDDLVRAEQMLTEEVGNRVAAITPDLVIAPTPHDLHHGHEVVGRAVRAVLEARPHARWWQYAIWGDLPFANLYIPLLPSDTERALFALGAYGGETQRNDYRDLMSGSWIRNRALGAERVFGFGAARPVEARAVELAFEVTHDGDGWRMGTRRVLTVDNITAPPTDECVDAWMAAPSPTAVRQAPSR